MKSEIARRETGATAALCLLAAALLTLLGAQSSPLYPLNLWDDANCLLTVGRVMRAGGVLYRDIYEQKGPTLYLIHALAAWMDGGSFFGVWVMQTLAWAATLFFAFRTLRARLPFPAALACAAMTGALAICGPSYRQGDSAEEFCLPLLQTAIGLALDAYARRRGPMPAARLFACGLLAGLVATIKYTVLGLFAGLCLCEGALALGRSGSARERARRALARAGVFLSGMALPILLWCAYFAAHGALGDFLTAYLYNNIFLYDAGGGAADALLQVLRLARDNAALTLLSGAGLLAFALLARENALVRACALVMGACAALALLAGRLWPYCVLPLWALAPVGLTGLLDALARIAHRALPRGNRRPSPGGAERGGRRALARAMLCALALTVPAAWVGRFSPNAYLRGVPLADLAQGRLAVRMEPGATLLQYSHLDDGLYLVSGALPQERFFVRLNVRYGAMTEALDEAVRDGRPDYVLVSWRELPEEFDRYALAAHETAYDDEGRLNKELYLYRRVDE